MTRPLPCPTKKFIEKVQTFSLSRRIVRLCTRNWTWMILIVRILFHHKNYVRGLHFEIESTRQTEWLSEQWSSLIIIIAEQWLEGGKRKLKIGSRSRNRSKKSFECRLAPASAEHRMSCEQNASYFVRLDLGYRWRHCLVSTTRSKMDTLSQCGKK